MSLQPGSRLGPYQITAWLGAGGMGEVYRATDTNLKREVAIKVLPDRVAADPDRLARFQREAEVLAALNHPHVGQIYGLERSGATTALVLELVEGSTLAERIAQGPMPVGEALRVAGQIAEALEAAHDRGIIHRDLKPANVTLTADGRVKVLDFGLARALNPTRSELAPEEAAESPTRTRPAMTQAGVVLGTTPYMSPEQARGQDVDRRTDIWAFGCVLYEMLTGTRAFDGSSTTDILAGVLGGEPDYAALPRSVPRWARRLLRLCLAKDPANRLRDIRDVRLEIAEARADEMAAGPPAAAGGSRWPTAVAIGLLCAAGGVAAGLGLRRDREVPAIGPLARFEFVLPEGGFLRSLAQRVVAVSRDGRQWAYVEQFGDRRIHVTRLDSLEVVPIEGTEGGTSPFFSPDGQWLGFWKDRQLQKVRLDGGAPIALCPARTVYGATWTEDGRILFGQAHFGIFEVAADGGEARVLVAPDRAGGELALEGPRVLPGGDWLLFSLLRSGDNWNRANLVAEHLDTGERRVLVEGGTDGRYLPTGHLLFVRDSALYGLPFDLETLTVRGSPVPVVEGLWRAEMFETGAGQFDVSATGTLVWAQRGPPFGRTLVWVDRAGQEEPLPMPVRSYLHVRLSPDGTRAVVDTIRDQDLWVYDLDRATMTRLTTAQRNLHPVWSHDGALVIADTDLGLALEGRPSDGAASAVELAAADAYHLTAVSAAPDGRTLAVERSDDFEAYDIGVVSLDGDGTVDLLVADPSFREMSPVFSPDGRWLAYVSDETGRNEVYVQPYPALDRRWLVSNAGGVEPQWSRAGTEIFYRTGAYAGTMMAVPVTTDPSFSAGTPRELFSKPPGYFGSEPISAHPTYDVSLDGERFLITKFVDGAALGPQAVQIVVNWFDELERLVPRE